MDIKGFFCVAATSSQMYKNNLIHVRNMAAIKIKVTFIVVLDWKKLCQIIFSLFTFNTFTFIYEKEKEVYTKENLRNQLQADNMMKYLVI